MKKIIYRIDFYVVNRGVLIFCVKSRLLIIESCCFITNINIIINTKIPVFVSQNNTIILASALYTTCLVQVHLHLIWARILGKQGHRVP